MEKLVITLLLLVRALITALGASELPRDVDGRYCYEDEAVMELQQTWTGTHHEEARDTGKLYCVAIDDMRPIPEEEIRNRN